MLKVLAVIVLTIGSMVALVGCPGGDCTNRHCGPNSAGMGSCGTCLTGETCSGSGVCVAAGCTAGSTQACACPAGTAMGSGTQTCQSDGTYDACAPCAPCTCGSPRHECGLDTCGMNSCGTCMGGFRCNGSGACEIEPTTQWVVTATTATIAIRDCAGNTWDDFGGLPDPEVCVDTTVSTTGIQYGAKYCTPPVSDVLTASWSTRNTFTLPASTLTNGMVVELADNDLPFPGQTLCRGPVAITEMIFRAGRIVIPCTCPAGSAGAGTQSGSMTFTLAPM